MLLGELTVFTPPAPFANESTFFVLADGRLLAIRMPPNPDSFGAIFLVLAGRRHLAVFMPVGKRAGALAELVAAIKLLPAVREPRLRRTVLQVLAFGGVLGQAEVPILVRRLLDCGRGEVQRFGLLILTIAVVIGGPRNDLAAVDIALGTLQLARLAVGFQHISHRHR